MEIKDCIKDPSDLHEEVLKGIQEVTINFSKALKTDTKISTSDLKRKLGELIDTNVDNINTEQIKETEDAINQIEQEWLKTILINDERYALLDDEKPSKAFLNMENSKGGYSNIVLLKRDTIFTSDDGSQYTVVNKITKGEEIRSTVKDDFQQIFKKQPDLNVGEADLEAFLVSDEDENTAQHHSPLAELRHRRNVTNWEMQKTGGEITSAELRACLFNKMKGNSAPGIDGFTVSWLRVFWEDMEALTTKAINDCYTKGELTETMNTAVIKLLRKGAKDPTYSNSYRPISLLSIHYKLASCAITQRLKPLMKTLIGRQQKAYITNNVIGSCLINLISAIRHVSIKKLSGLILLIDFKKAFDSIDHGFIRTALRAYGFEKSIIRWILLFFDKREAFILLGGHKTENIQLQQGVPQGDVVSPYIFILMVEILLIKINYTCRIKGIIFAKHESRSETFADDTSILIERKEEYLRYAMKFIQMFHNISGLCCNLEKTVVIPIGENTNTNDRLCPELNLEWSNKFTLLGFSLDSTLSTLDDNFNKCMIRAKKLIVKWRKYNLSIMGRITVAKSMLLSQFTYVVSVLDITKAQINQIQLLIDTFIMHNSHIGPGPSKKAWIKSAILHGPKHLGGLGGVKVEEFIHGLNISWIHRYSTKNYNDHWCDLLDKKLGFGYNKPRSEFLLWGPAKWSHLTNEGIPFISKILSSFKLFCSNFVSVNSKTDNRWLYQPLFFNPNLSTGGKPYLVPSDYSIATNSVSNTAKVIDVFDNDGDIITPEIMTLSGLGISNRNFMGALQFRMDLRKVIGPGKKYSQKPVPKTIRYTGNKPMFMADTVEEYFNCIKKGSNKFREIIAQNRYIKINDSARLQNKLDVRNIPPKVVTQTFKNMHSKIIPNDAKDYKIRAILGKTQFNTQLKHWTDVEEACYRCGQPEDFKHGVYNCTEALNLYKYIFNKFKLGANVNIKNMILSHERPYGAKDENIIRLELIDTISTIALKWVLVSRVEKSNLHYRNCLNHIWGHLQLVANSFPKYRAAIAGLDFELDTG